MRIIGYHINQDGIYNSDAEFCGDKRNYLYWLLTSKPETIRVCYHLDYFVAQLLHQMGITKEQGQELHDTTQLKYGIYEINYVAGKFLNIKKNGGKYFQNFSDVSQYVDDWKLSENDDAQQKADKAKEIGTQVYEAFIELNMNILPTSLTSPISVFSKDVIYGKEFIRAKREGRYVKTKMDLSNDADLQSPIGQYAYESLQGGQVEAFRVGHFEDCYDFDMVSAYGSTTANLLDVRFGKWTRNRSYQNDAYYGYALCDVEIWSEFSPVRINGKSFIGKTQLKLPKNLIDLVNDCGWGKVEPIDGVWFFPEKKAYPFKAICEKLHEVKQSTKSGIKKTVIKDILASIWGLRLQVDTDGEMGDLFCSVDGVNVESEIQSKVAQFVYEHKWFELLDINIDGVKMFPKGGVTSCTVSNIPSLDARGMGEWKLSAHAPTFILGSGASAVKGKETVNELSINYDSLMQMIKDNPDATEYELKKTTCRTLADALQEDNWKSLGSLITTVRHLNFNDKKREWEDLPMCGRDLLEKQYKSIPLDITQILNVESELEEIEETEEEYAEV